MGRILSISVAAYNVEKYIEKTIQSVLRARNKDFIQLIIVNDGSYDKTASIVKKYEKQFKDVLLLINKQNGGHGSTINMGIEHADGKYFMVLDGDDWLDTGELEKLIDFLSINDTDMVLLNSVNCFEGGKNVRVIQYPKYEFDRVYDELDFNHNLQVGLSSAIIKTSLFKKSKYRCIENCYYDDLQYDAFITLLSNSFIYKNLFLYQYRLGRKSQSVSMAGFQKHIDMQLIISETLKDLYYANSAIYQGKKDSLLNCWISIEKSIVATYLSFKPTKNIKNKLDEHLSKIKDTDVYGALEKNYRPLRFYNITGSYTISSWIYRLLRS